jgi:hypothetical protein
MSSTNRIPLVLGLVGAFFLVKNFVEDEIENYDNNLGVKPRGFRPQWRIADPLAVTMEIDIDIRNDNRIGGQVLGFDGFITWGKDGAKLGALTVQPFDLRANGHINESTWVVRVPLLGVSQEVREQIQAGNWAQLPWLDGRLRTSYGPVTIKNALIRL